MSGASRVSLVAARMVFRNGLHSDFGAVTLAIRGSTLGEGLASLLQIAYQRLKYRALMRAHFGSGVDRLNTHECALVPDFCKNY